MNTHVIITFSKTKYFLTEQNHRELKGKKLTDFIKTSCGSSVKCSNIAEILSIDEYYKQYPNEKPVKNNYSLSDNYFKNPQAKIAPHSFSKRQIIEKNKKRLSAMISGMEKYINSNKYKGTTKPLSLLETMKNKVLCLEKEIELINPSSILYK